MATGPTRFTYYKQDGFEVWGKQYQDSAGAVSWRLRVFSDQDRRMETYEDVTGDPPEGKRPGESKAMRDAIAAWLGRVHEKQGENGRLDLPQNPKAAAALETAAILPGKPELNAEERTALSPRVSAYIQYLEQELSRKTTN
jgi:hypothetical protein